MVNQMDQNLYPYLQWLFSHSTDHSLMVLLVDQTTRDWDGAPPGWLVDFLLQIRNLEFFRVRNRFGFPSVAELSRYFTRDHRPSDLSSQAEVRAATLQISESTYDQNTADSDDEDLPDLEDA